SRERSRSPPRHCSSARPPAHPRPAPVSWAAAERRPPKRAARAGLREPLGEPKPRIACPARQELDVFAKWLRALGSGASTSVRRGARPTAIGSEGCLGIEGGGSKSSAAPATTRRRLCTAEGGPVSARHFAGDRWCRGSPPTYRVADTISDAQ